MRNPLAGVGRYLVATALVACSASGESGLGPAETVPAAVKGEPDQSELRKFILAASAPPTPAQQDPTQTGEDKQIKTENGVAEECVYKRYTGTALYETLVSFDPNADSIWPGALVQTKTLPEGLAAPIALARRPGTITVGDAIIGGQAQTYSKTIPEPTFAASRDAIGSVFSGADVKLAAKTNYLAETAYSMNEAVLKIGVAASWMSGSVKANFAGSWLNKKTTMVVRFVQAYYTVSFAAPPSPEKIFGPNVTVNDARPYMGPGNAPAFVSSVTYGRMLIMKIESDDSESDVRAALDVAFSKVRVDLDARQKKVLQNSSISVFILGGSPDDAAHLQTADAASRPAALSAYIDNGANYDPRSPGVAISYTIRRLADNETIKVASTIDYQIPVCTPAAVKVLLTADNLYFGQDGKAGGSTSGSYDVWVETSQSAGGALPPTPGKDAGTDRQDMAAGTAHVDDGTTVPLQIQRYVTVNQQQDAHITIGAHVRTDAKGKQCDMSRTHVYRFNPQTNAGEWTNAGVNKLNCVDGDTAFIGNNALSADLNYTFTP